MRYALVAALALLIVGCKSGGEGDERPGATTAKAGTNAKTGTEDGTRTRTTTTTTSGRIDWVKDLEVLATELPKRHKNAFHAVTKPRFDRAVAALRSQLAGLNDDQVLAGLMRLVAMIGDGHTILTRPHINYLQLSLYWFADGIYVLAAPRGHAWAVGRKLTRLGDVSIDDAIVRLTPLVPHDNAMQLRQLMPNFLIDATLLHGAGLSQHANRAVYTLAAADGKTRQLVVALGQRVQAPVPTAPPPLYRTRRRAYYWRTYLAKDKTMYVQYNQCADAPNLSFAAFTKGLLQALDKLRPQRLVIDLRFNGGGNSALFDPLLAGLARRPWMTKRGKLFAIIGRATFSSAVLNTMALKRQLGAILVGEPSGGKPSHYGEVKHVRLPSSGYTVGYATKLFRFAGADGPSIVPDVKVTLTHAAFAAGKDPALTAALRYRR